MNTAFLFPGQGAQFVGMGADIVKNFPVAKEIFEKASRIIGYDLNKICFEGPAEKLNSTAISQPAIFTTSAAILEVLNQNSFTSRTKPDVAAGLSLGEYTALYVAGSINFEDALTLVQKRGQAMQQAADATEGGMVSIIGIDEEKVARLCEQAREENEVLLGVNFNCPGQIVISGSKSACERAEKLAEEYGAVKAIRLVVAGAFHTELMTDAAQSLTQALVECNISQPSKARVIANINTEYYNSAEEIEKGLIKQLTSPILWQTCMEKLLSEGIENFYEIGPGRVLTGLMRRINRKIKVTNINDLDSLNNILKISQD